MNVFHLCWMGRGKKTGGFNRTWEKESLIIKNPVALLSILNGSLSAN
jgi:hypothetical protein